MLEMLFKNDEFFYSRQTRGSHSFYAMKQVVMEIITAAYTMGQWHLISYYFGFNWYLAIRNTNYLSWLINYTWRGLGWDEHLRKHLFYEHQ